VSGAIIQLEHVSKRFGQQLAGANLVAREITRKTRITIPGTPATGPLTAHIQALSNTAPAGPTAKLTIKPPKK
jgi:hypothetical protein